MNIQKSFNRTVEKIAAAAPESANKMALAEVIFISAVQTGISGEIEESVSILQNIAGDQQRAFAAEPENKEFAFVDSISTAESVFIFRRWVLKRCIFGTNPTAREIMKNPLSFFERAIALAENFPPPIIRNIKYPRAAAIQKSNLAEALAEIGRTDEALKLQRRSSCLSEKYSRHRCRKSGNQIRRRRRLSRFVAHVNLSRRKKIGAGKFRARNENARRTDRNRSAKHRVS